MKRRLTQMILSVESVVKYSKTSKLEAQKWRQGVVILNANFDPCRSVLTAVAAAMTQAHLQGKEAAAH